MVEVLLLMMTMMTIKTYSDLINMNSFEERLKYLLISGFVGETTFGFDRYLNQAFYRSAEWKTVRRNVILRDNGCDMGLADYPIGSKIIVHHMNPMTIDSLSGRDSDILNPEYLVCVSIATHNAIHYGRNAEIPNKIINRTFFDTCPWR